MSFHFSSIYQLGTGIFPIHLGISLTHSGIFPIYLGIFHVHSGIFPIHSGIPPVHSGLFPIMVYAFCPFWDVLIQDSNMQPLCISLYTYYNFYFLFLSKRTYAYNLYFRYFNYQILLDSSHSSLHINFFLIRP